MNTAGKTYLDILKEHYPNVVLNELYGYCPAGFFKYGMDMHHPDCSAQCDECWLCAADSEWFENGEYDVPEEWKAAAEQDKPSEPPAPTQTENAMPAAFDYSELDSDTAAKLENVTAEIFNVRKEYIFTMAKKVAYAHDLLANHYGGKFGLWCESIGITRKTGNNLIHVVKLLDNSTLEEQENLNKLSDGNIKLLYEAARPSAPPELVEQVKSGDITTHKEYIALKKELEAAEEQNAVLSAEKEQFHRASKANLEKLNEERERNSELEQQIRELESRPVDVMVQTDADAERKFNETIRKINLDFEKFRDEADKDLADMRNQRNAALDRAEAAEAKLNAPKAESNVKSFVIRMTMDDYDAIVKALSGNAYLKNIIQKAQVLRV